MSKHTLFRLRMPNFGGFISLWVCLTWPWTLDTTRRAKIYSQPNNHVVICCRNHLKHYHKFYKETSLKLPKKCNVCESNILQSTPHHMAWLNTYFFELFFFFNCAQKLYSNFDVSFFRMKNWTTHTTFESATSIKFIISYSLGRIIVFALNSLPKCDSPSMFLRPCMNLGFKTNGLFCWKSTTRLDIIFFCH